MAHRLMTHPMWITVRYPGRAARDERHSGSEAAWRPSVSPRCRGLSFDAAPFHSRVLRLLASVTPASFSPTKHAGHGLLAAALAATLIFCVACGARSSNGAGASLAASPGGKTASGGADRKKVVRTERVEIHGESFDLELAVDDDARSRGLGGRTSIPDKGGMLFVFPNTELRRFWMLDCEIDIDIIFLDPLGIVTAVHEMKAEPRQPGESLDAYKGRLKLYSSIAPAQYAIELKAGSIERLGIKPGEKIQLDRRKLKSLAR